MSINEVSNNGAILDQYRTPEKTTEPKDNELGRDAFLELMVAQLNNQNPLEPTDTRHSLLSWRSSPQLRELTSSTPQQKP